MHVQWSCKKFIELSPDELYAILKLRSAVFVVEQHCAYLDCDDKDQKSHHLMGWKDNNLAAYSRLLPQALAFEEASIGRVVTSPQIRKSGLGRELMQQSIRECHRLFGKTPIRIGAQLYLNKFYESVGFQPCGTVYQEDGIDHIEMKL